MTKNPKYSNFGYAAQVQDAVSFVRKFSGEAGLSCIDLAANPKFSAETEDEYQSNDGVHFNEKGYRVLAEEIRAAIGLDRKKPDDDMR